MDNLKIFSQNCRGLRDNSKRKDVFEYIRSKNFNIYCLQDTHFADDIEHVVRSQWGFECICSHGSSDSRGVCILLNNNFEYKLSEKITDTEGNYIILNIEIRKKFTLTLVNIYGPNQDKPIFYTNLNNRIKELQGDFLILCGDINLVLNFELDCFNYVNRNNPRAANELINLKTEHNLMDPWRLYNPDTKKYTWFRKTPIKRQELISF